MWEEEVVDPSPVMFWDESQGRANRIGLYLGKSVMLKLFLKVCYQ